MMFERAFMEQEKDPFEFVLAESLGMSLADVREMSNRDYIEWQAFYVYRAGIQALEAKKAEAKRGR